MKKLVLIVFAVLVVSVSMAKKPALEKVEIDPLKAKPGDNITFVLTFSGHMEDIKSVKLYNLEFPYEAPVIELKPDTEAGENVWKAIGPVPYEAPLGVYNWEVKAVDKKDKEIVDKNCKEQKYGKAGKLSFEII